MNSDTSQSLPDSFPSSRIESRPTRPLNPPHSLAILPLDNLTPNASLHWLGRSLSEMLANDLATQPSLTVVAREAMGSVLREQWLQQRGFSSSLPPVDLGQLQGVRYVVRGGFHQQKDNLRIDLQVIDVETGVIARSLSAQGSPSEIPRIEHDLVVQLINLFQAPFDSTEPAVREPEDVEGPQHIFPGPRVGGTGSLSRNRDVFNDQSVHQLDLQLSLERMTQHRMDAYGAAEAFWQKGWSAELGQPRYQVRESSETPMESLPLLTLPIALFMQQNKIAPVLERLRGVDLPAIIHLETDGLSRGQSDDSGTSQLFFGHLRQSRRVFVRALNEQGELMAVYSKWGWHTRGILQDSLPERMVFPMWPEPFIHGTAEFPVSWIERNGQHVTFDLVIVPISDEHLSIVLEPTSESEERKDFMEIPADAVLLLPLKNWIQKNWKPPITEALPVAGHLPANKQTVDALLNLQEGKIIDIQFLNISRGTLFFRSLEELKASLLGYCLDCQDSKRISPSLTLQTIRLQLTLVKDLHALQFGSRSH